MLKKKTNYLTVVSVLVAFAGVAILIYSLVNAIFADVSQQVFATSNSVGNSETISDDGMKYIGMGLACTGFLGAGIGQGHAAGRAAEGVSRNPEAEGKIRNMMIVGAAIAETSALYSLVIAILIGFVI
ncbi:MAG: hypothetical protein HPAVJP_0510 [Candidatus Hepatoplasma vulgare]|nr:MAG: hypothetical protein HPAVJP_0510 [Candidatus Hepatoplasma sp.]